MTDEYGKFLVLMLCQVGYQGSTVNGDLKPVRISDFGPLRNEYSTGKLSSSTLGEGSVRKNESLASFYDCLNSLDNHFTLSFGEYTLHCRTFGTLNIQVDHMVSKTREGFQHPANFQHIPISFDTMSSPDHRCSYLALKASEIRGRPGRPHAQPRSSIESSHSCCMMFLRSINYLHALFTSHAKLPFES